jgi:catalase (peroxidase I)
MTQDAWIEAETYSGPERRAGGSGTRIFDRRRRATSWSEPPALPTAIRQLKSASLGLHGAAQWARFTVRLDGAIRLAERQGQMACVEALSGLRNAIEKGHHPAAPVSPATADAYLERARMACQGL